MERSNYLNPAEMYGDDLDLDLDMDFEENTKVNPYESVNADSWGDEVEEYFAEAVE